MFSKSFQTKIAKFLSVIVLFCNVSPAFAMQAIAPDYDVRVRRHQAIDQATGEVVQGFLVEAQKLITQTATQAAEYQTIFSQVIFPFMATTAMIQAGVTNLYEILQKAKTEAQIFGAPDTFSAERSIETEVSRGYCLSIPEVGDFLITHDGDVVLDSQSAIQKSLRISAPSQVILNNSTAVDIDVEATAAILTGSSQSAINSLRFRGTADAGGLTNGLFIDKKSKLQVGHLALENALLLNTGSLTVQQQMDLNGGYFFNTGTLQTSANPSLFSNISYLFNGTTGSMTASGRMVIGASNFTNLGTIRANSISVVASTLLDNQGTITSDAELELSGCSKIINTGLIDGKSGSVGISGSHFEHKSGEIRAAKVDFGSDETVLSGAVMGQEGFFHGKVTATGGVNFQHGVIDGLFIGDAESIQFAERLDLTGVRAEVHNRKKIIARDVISDAETGIMDGGEVSATSVNVKKHLQIKSSMPQLTSMSVDDGASLLVGEGANVSALRKVINAGKTRILAEIPELEDLQNAITGHLQLESSAPLTKITNLDHLQGQLDVKAQLPNITNLRLQSGAKFTALEGASLSGLRDIYTQTGASLLLEKSTVSGVKNVYNSGTMTSKTKLTELEAIYNSPDGTLHLFEPTLVFGRGVSENDRSLISSISTLADGRISVFNEGKILLDSLSFIFFANELKKGLSINLKVLGSYVASANAVLRMNVGGIVASDFINDGIMYSPNGLKITQFGRDMTKWGRAVAENGIEYEIQAPVTATFKFPESFRPIINGPNKLLKVKSTSGIEVSRPINMNVDMDVETPTFKVAEDLTVRSFKAKTDTFTFEPNADRTKKNTLSAMNFFDISTRDFINTSGKLQTHGREKSRLEVGGIFRNTGGGTLEKDKPEVITNYTWEGGKLVPHTKTILREVYNPDLDKSGVITTGGILEIISREFDNRFGIINAASRLAIRSSGEIFNECGLIYSGGPTTINGALLKNGYMKGSEEFVGVDPNAPIKEQRTVPYQYWVSSGYQTSRGGVAGVFGGKKWVDTSHWDTGSRDELVVVGYPPLTQSSSASQYPGYIFSNGDLNIDMDTTGYFGTIVSGGNVRIKGIQQESISLADRGTIIVRGDVNLELQKAALAQLTLQAQNIFMNLMQELTIRGIVMPVVMPNGSVSQIVDLQRLGQQLGFLASGSTYTEQGMSVLSPTGLIPTGMPITSESARDFSVYPTESAGFMRGAPDSRYFMPTLQDSVLNQLITLTLTPFQGRDILLRIDLAGDLRRTGASIAETFRGTQSLVLPNADPAILFDKSNNPDVAVEIDGQKVMVPLYNPFLLTDAISRVINTIRAEKMLRIQSLENIRVEPGEINLESEDLSLESAKQVQVAAEFKHNPITGNRISVNPVELSVPGTLSISGRTGVSSEGFQPSAKRVQITSAEGNVVDLEMPLDPTYLFYNGGRTVIKDQKTVTSTFVGSDGVSFSAPMGEISQHGTDVIAGTEGVVFDAPKYTWQPAYEESGFFSSNRKGFTSVDTKTPKAGGMHTSGSIVFKSKDATLIGAQIVSDSVSNPVDGRFSAVPAYATQESHSVSTKSNSWGIGHSTLEVYQTRSTPVATQIITNHFQSLGVGVCELEGTVVRALDMAITKTLEEKAAYEKIHTVITQKSSGFCAPKIKGDPFAEALRGIPSAIVTFDGDTIPTALNVIGTGAQALCHAETLANLSTLKYNPMEVIPQILLSRYVTGFTYSNTRTVTTMNESRPVQSHIETGVLRVANDRTHLEGVWNISNRGEINTGTFIASAPQHTVDTHTETSGWSVSVSPAALLSAYLNPGLLTGMACLPNVSVQQSDGSTSQTSHVPALITANDLFIRCDNAVFSGTQIHGRLVDAVVTGDLTIETLANEFRSESTSTGFSTCLGCIAGLTQNVCPSNMCMDARLSAIPHIRIANEEELSRKIGELASIVGTERFYLTVGGLLYKKSAEVGLKPDGVVVHNPEERINAGRILEEKVQEIESHERHVFNPAISEFVAMMNQVDELNELKAKITYHQALDVAYQSVGKVKPEGVYVTTYDAVLDALLSAGATTQEIEHIILNPQLGNIISEAQNIRSSYGNGYISVITGSLSKAEYDAKVAKDEQAYNTNYFAASLELFTDAAIVLDDFATENPRMAQLSMLALDVAMSGPSRFVMNYCSQELGIQGKIDECKDRIHGWLSAKVSAISGLDTDTSDILVSGGMFGVTFGFAIAGVQPKEKVLDSARNSARISKAWKAKIHGKAQITGTPGHEIGSMKVAIRESKKPEVTRVHMDTSLKEATGGQTKSRMRPDVTVVREDGRITTHEVLSKSQDKKQLQGKIARMRDELPDCMRGPRDKAGSVFDIEGKELK